MTKLFQIFIAFFLILFASPSLSFAQNNAPNLNGPSFDCRLAKTPIEKTICASPSLSQKDAILSHLYQGAKISAFGFDKSNQFKAQLDWLKNRDACLKNKDDIINCIENRYKARIIELASANLFTDYQYSIEQIEEFSPGTAPFYRAIYLYVNNPQTPERNETIAALLTPAFENIKENYSYPYAILDDMGIKTTKDMFKSDSDFASAFAILGVGIEDSLSLPCAALLKKPKLIEALNAVFGSTYDSQLMYSDCLLTLPPTPNLQALDTAVNRAAPECEGTIRFAIYRNNAKIYEQIVLGQTSELLSQKPKKYDAKTQKFINNSKQLAPAKSEILGYYNKYIPQKKINAAQVDRILKDYISSVMTGCEL